jgi:aryl-alcohol dehydrogenase-like predicted oxidoreductase
MAVPRAHLGPLEVSALALGTWRTFERIPRERALATLRRARELGITFLDEARYDDETGTAPIPSGYSEVLLGELVVESGFARGGGVVISEKLWWQFWPQQSAAQELAESLGRLRFDAVDLIYAVHPPEGLEIARALDEVAAILESGAARAWGVANWTAEQVEQALEAAPAAGIGPPVAAQLPFSLVRRDWAAEERMLDALHAGGTGLVASAILEGGLLSGRYSQGSPTGRLLDSFAAAENRRALAAGQALVTLAREWETTPVALALAFVFEHPLFACALVGASSPEQLDELAGAFALHARLGPDELERLASL